MPTIGLDCHLILDGTGYFIEPHSFAVVRPRVRSSTYNRLASNPATRAGAGERYVDQGHGKREWQFIVVAWQAIDTFAGQRVTLTGQQYRDALWTSYEKVNTTLSFTDPAGGAWTVRFDDLSESIEDVRAQAEGGLQYTMHVALIEA